jgi:raffinose/stachyose/melibiose transport system permease protein
MNWKWKKRSSDGLRYLILGGWSLIVLFPIYTLVVNSLKSQNAIFRDPFALPAKLDFSGYQDALTLGKFDLYFFNTIFVTAFSLTLILLLGAMVSYALVNWKSRASGWLYVFFIGGMMIPIRLGTINLIQIMKTLGLMDTLYSLIPVYAAMGLPMAVLILTTFIRTLPRELYEAARIDGASEFRIFASIILPLTRPALVTVAIYNLITIWNDFWFPLSFVRQEQSRTVSLGVSLLFGQYQTDWNSALSVLSLAALPVILVYIGLSKQLIGGLTAGAVKG